MGPLFVGTALVEGVRRRNYSPRRHPVSALARGDSGWIQTANFLVAGMLTCMFSAGARSALRSGPGSTAVPMLIATAGVGLLGAGAYATDPVSGYPPGVPDRLTGRTRAGMLHELSSVPVLIGLPAASYVYGRRCAARGEYRWARSSKAAAAVSLVAFLAAGAGFGQAPRFVDWAGLFQRIGIVTAFGWASLIALRLRRRR